MKTMKFLSLAALALTFAACSSNDDELTAQQPAEQPNNGEITITATIEAGDGAATRTLIPSGTNIASTFETTDQFAILFNDGSSQVKRIATVSSIDGTTANITFTIPTSVTSNTDCTIVYPASAANASNTDADVATALATQDGALATAPDVRKGTATIDVSTNQLTGVTQLAAQNAIFKFTTQNLSATAITASEFKVSDNDGNVITTVTLATAASEFYVALPVLSADTYWFNATVGGKPYIAKATVSTATSAGKFYSTTVKMATVGDVILSDGKFAAKGTDGERAIITYVGSDNCEASPYNHGLAFAMSDANGGSTIQWGYSTTTDNSQHPNYSNSSFTIESGLQYNNATHNSDNYKAFKAAMANNSTAAPTGCSAWFLASGYQWTKMIAGAGSAGNLKSLAGLTNNYYWTSSENSAGKAWRYEFNKTRFYTAYKNQSESWVRACLAF